MWACVCVPGSVCAWEHAIAGHSEHSHIQAIIISPPAIITTSDSPLLPKLISPSFPGTHPPCSNLSPSAITTLTNAFFWHLRSSTFFFFVLPFPLCLTTQGKAGFPRRFIHLYLLRGCYALLRCVYIEYLTSAGHTPHPQRQTEKGKKEKKQKLREKMERRLQLFGNQLIVFTLQKPICTSFTF